MKASVYRFKGNNWETHPAGPPVEETSVSLALCFASKEMLKDAGVYDLLKTKFPGARVAMCSTAGEIYHDSVQDHSLVVAALQFDKTTIGTSSVSIKDYPNTYMAAMALARQLPKEKLAYVMVLSDGSLVNGSDLVKGLTSQFSKNVLVTGGLAGDGANFQSTLVGLDGQPAEGNIIAIGFYGDQIKVTHGSQGGWDIFGLEKRVTNASGNILLELENQNALELYKKYLGPESGNLPGSALLFPLSVVIPGTDKPVVRTILSINEENKSMTFAGDVPVGSKVRFMKANFDRLTSAAAEAAAITVSRAENPVFSLLISCVGRKLVLGEKITEEVKAVSHRFRDQTLLAGFYSYGEISPFNDGGSCQLHNQTMTITSFYEL